MGTWIGHIAPGVFFVIFALWWHINNCARYIRSLDNENDEKSKRKKIKFQGSVTYPCFWLPIQALRRAPTESFLKIIITSIHFTIEIITGYISIPRPHLGEENAHHTAMLFGFFLGAWVEVLVHYKVPLPKRTTHVLGCLAFAIEGLMMIFHLHARSMVDAHIHVLLAVTMSCSTISALAECIYPDKFWLIVTRSFFALTQGTWFLQAAYVIWPQTTNPYFIWDPDSHRSVSLLTMSYAYQLAGNALILLVVYLIVYMFVAPSNKTNQIPIDHDEEEETIGHYKLIMDANDEDNGL